MARKEMEDLIAQVAEQVTVEKSAGVLIDSLQDSLAKAIADADWPAVQKVIDDLKASKTELEAAFVENTPQA
jgi:hypothetical protein